MALIQSCRIEPYRRNLPPALLTQRPGQAPAAWHLHLELESGEIGSGDVAPWPGFGADETVVEAELQELAATIVGRALPSLAEVLEWLGETLCGPVVRHGLEGAVLSLMSQARGQTLGQYLWSLAETRVPVHGLVSTPEEAERMGRAGVQTLKMKVGGSVPEDARRVLAVRSKCPRVRLRLDANARWSREQAATFLDALGETEQIILEQPVAAEDFAAFEWLKGRTGIQLSADESTVLSPTRMVEDPAVDEVVLKPMFLGGLLAAERIARDALSRGKGICITHALESSVGRGNTLTLAAAFSAAGPHGVTSQDWPIVDGCISYPPRLPSGVAA